MYFLWSDTSQVSVLTIRPAKCVAALIANCLPTVCAKCVATLATAPLDSPPFSFFFTSADGSPTFHRRSQHGSGQLSEAPQLAAVMIIKCNVANFTVPVRTWTLAVIERPQLCSMVYLQTFLEPLPLQRRPRRTGPGVRRPWEGRSGAKTGEQQRLSEKMSSSLPLSQSATGTKILFVPYPGYYRVLQGTLDTFLIAWIIHSWSESVLRQLNNEKSYYNVLFLESN